ncbi:MAG: RNA polymerase sigma factor [Chitinophagaceae bacterium]
MTDKAPTVQPGKPGHWINLLKANDEQALKSLYVANYSKIESYILNNNGSVDDAKDIYQEAFVAVWRNIQLDKVSMEDADKFHGYLFRVAQYKWLDQLRSTKRKKTNSLSEIEIAEEAPVQLDEQEEDYLTKVKMHYAAMGEPCKDVLHRFYFLKQSMSEIAAFFSWTEATAKNNKYRCLQRLRNLIVPKNNTL